MAIYLDKAAIPRLDKKALESLQVKQGFVEVTPAPPWYWYHEVAQVQPHVYQGEAQSQKQKTKQRIGRRSTRPHLSCNPIARLELETSPKATRRLLRREVASDRDEELLGRPALQTSGTLGGRKALAHQQGDCEGLLFVTEGVLCPVATDITTVKDGGFLR